MYTGLTFNLASVHVSCHNKSASGLPLNLVRALWCLQVFAACSMFGSDPLTELCFNLACEGHGHTMPFMQACKSVLLCISPVVVFTCLP